MIPMSQYSLTQLEDMAKAQGNALALELIDRIDGSFSPEQGTPSEVPDFYDLDNEKDEIREESFEKGKVEGVSEGTEIGKEKVLDALRIYLFNCDFTDENIDTFVSEITKEMNRG